MKQNRKDPVKPDLGTERIGTLIVKLAVPAIVAQIVNLLYNMVDKIYIGHIPGTGDIALTGLGLCFPIIMLVTAFSMLIGSGGAPRAAIAMGEGNDQKAEQILGSCTVLVVVIAAVLTALCEVFAAPLLKLFGASSQTLPYALSYLRIYAAGSISVMISLGLNMFITSQGFSTVAMKTVLIGAVLNILLDPVFIFVFGMGVQGAAIATVLAQTASACWVLHFLVNQAAVKIRRKNLRLQWAVVAPVLALGVSPFIMSATESLLNIAFNASLSRYGGDVAVGSMTILASISQIANLPMHGLTMGAQPIMSFNYGAKKPERVRQTYRILFVIVMSFTFVFWLLAELFPQMYVRIFTNEPALVSYASWALRIYLGGQFLMSAQIVVQQTFVALGQAKLSLFIAVLRKIILLIPLILILPVFFADKAFAVFLAEPVTDTISALTAASLFAWSIRKILARNTIEAPKAAH